MPDLDELDRRILALFRAEPQVGILAASRRLGIARGTVQARLDRLTRTGVVSSWAPTVSPAALGYRVTAFVTVEISQQHGRQPVVDHLRAIPELLECWSVTGPGDLLCRIVGRENEDLQRVIDRIVGHPDIVRTETVIGLTELIERRTDPLLAG